MFRQKDVYRKGKKKAAWDLESDQAWTPAFAFGITVILCKYFEFH